MNNLRRSIEVFFSRINPDIQLMAQDGLGGIRKVPLEVDWNEFRAQAVNHFPEFSLDELESVYQKLEDDWCKNIYNPRENEVSVFNLPIHFTRQVLEENDGEPRVRYEHLLRWNELTLIVGEDLLSCSYLAYMDNRSSRERHHFQWKAILDTNNFRLKALLDQGVAENHFHLYASGPIFEMSWLYIVNHPSALHSTFEYMNQQQRQVQRTISSFTDSGSDLLVRMYKAIALRMELWSELREMESKNYPWSTLIRAESRTAERSSWQIHCGELQGVIESLRMSHGALFSFSDGTEYHPDYALESNDLGFRNNGTFILAGERHFLYTSFKYIYGNPTNETFRRRFYAYLLIKTEFRAELIQVNKRVGFKNFKQYQDRKNFFIPSGSVYEWAFLKMAVDGTREAQRIESFEWRVTPEKSASRLHSKMSQTALVLRKQISHQSFPASSDSESIFNEFSIRKGFFTLHFAKASDSISKKPMVGMFTCRHADLRATIRQQALAIGQLKESMSSSANYIRGIDAASSEFNARPEVFAQVFRYLKDHKKSGKNSKMAALHTKGNTLGVPSDHRLRATFHAGEDFYDITDGLRTIYEAIYFLNLSQGDRLGHALALGISPIDYYGFKGNELMLPKGILIDNISWLLAMARKFNCMKETSEIQRLEKRFNDLFQEIYLSTTDFVERGNWNSHVFHDAWKLRGDDPTLYRSDLHLDIEQKPHLSYWERCRINHFFPTRNGVRNNQNCKYLYQQYHYNQEVKLNSENIGRFRITEAYIRIVQEVQKGMQKLVMQRNIGIECNPTSNYLIGTIGRYSNHPILKFFNLGLENDPDKVNSCPQLFVSINTDDQGVFGTSLENEYALMAIALEKMKDEFGTSVYQPARVYDWIDRIRRMGIEQSFIR